MTDSDLNETADRAGESDAAPAAGAGKSDSPPYPPPRGPEPVILEETITRRKTEAAAREAPAQPPAKSPEPVPGPQPVVSETQPRVLPESPLPELLPPPAEPPQKEPAPQPRSAVAGKAKMSDILKSVKLPERFKVEPELPKTAPAAFAAQTELREAIAEHIVSADMPPPAPSSPSAESATPGLVTPHRAEKKSGIVAPVHTLKDDLQDAVRDTKLSLVHAASLEEDRRARQARAPAPAALRRSKRTLAILFGAALLVLIGGSAVFGVYTIMKQRSAAPPATPLSSILFSEQTAAISLDGESPQDLKQALAGARNASEAPLGSITRIVPIITATSSDGAAVQRPATFGEFMAALGTRVPDDLVRALGDDFFFGIHTVDKNAPLLVVPVTSYDHAFAGMLAWEPSMNPDLAPVFTPVSMFAKDQNGLPIQRAFTDAEMSNYDVRELKDDAGAIELYYSFPTRGILVIAESPYSFPEILNRLQARGEL